MNWMLMPLRRYADFSGRSRRMEYWMWVLLQFIIYFVFFLITMVIGGSLAFMGDPGAMMGAGVGLGVLSLVYMLWWLGSLIPSFAVSVRRLHDTNRSGWWVIAPLAPMVLMIASIFGFIGAAATGSNEAVGVGIFAAGALYLIGFLAMLVLAIVVFVFTVLEGTRGPNRFGPDPKQPGYANTFS